MGSEMCIRDRLCADRPAAFAAHRPAGPGFLCPQPLAGRLALESLQPLAADLSGRHDRGHPGLSAPCPGVSLDAPHAWLNPARPGQWIFFHSRLFLRSVLFQYVLTPFEGVHAEKDLSMFKFAGMTLALTAAALSATAQADVEVDLGSPQRVTQLFAYPNNCNVICYRNWTLEETVCLLYTSPSPRDS